MTEDSIVFYTAATPNGHKVAILLEELRGAGLLPRGYETRHVSFAQNEQKSDWYLQICPNGRVPAIVHTVAEKATNVWESASVLLYIVQVYDKEHTFWFPPGTSEYTELLNWLFFIQGGLGPMQGQLHHFYRYAPEKIEYGIKRYRDETLRLYGTYEKHLGAGRKLLAGDKFTIADMCTFTWVRCHAWGGLTLEEFPHLSAWVERIYDRPGVLAGVDVPEKDDIRARAQDPALEARLQKEAIDWIMKPRADETE